MSKSKIREHALLNAAPGTVYMQYKVIGTKGEGTFSQVLKARSLNNGKLVAIKCMKSSFDSMDQVNRLREIQALRRLSPHPNIIQLLEVLYDKKTGNLSLVFECMDKNVYEMIGSRKSLLEEAKVRLYMYQLFKAIHHMHRNAIFHRDVKPENILITNNQLKLADFGSCTGVYSKQPFTEYISTRWYRAPECLLTDGHYAFKMDMWGAGCVFFEIVTFFPLFPGSNEVDQVQKIHSVLGTPSPEVLSKFKKNATAHMRLEFPTMRGTGLAKLLPPNTPPDCIDLMQQLLAYDPDMRITSKQALRHPYFRELREKEKSLRNNMNSTKNSNNSMTGGKSSRSSSRSVALPAISGAIQLGKDQIAITSEIGTENGHPHASSGVNRYQNGETIEKGNIGKQDASKADQGIQHGKDGSSPKKQIAKGLTLGQFHHYQSPYLTNVISDGYSGNQAGMRGSPIPALSLPPVHTQAIGQSPKSRRLRDPFAGTNRKINKKKSISKPGK